MPIIKFHSVFFIVLSMQSLYEFESVTQLPAVSSEELVTEETRMLEDPSYECLPSSVHQCDDQFAMCSVSVTHSYESTIVIDLSEQTALAQTAAGEASVVHVTERQVTPTVPSIVPSMSTFNFPVST